MMKFMRKLTDLIDCPVKNEQIESFDCMVICDIVDGMFTEQVLDEQYGIAMNEKLRDTCINCLWHDIGRL